LHAHLTAGKRNLLWRLMWRHFMLIRVKADERLEETEFRCLSPRQGRDITAEHAKGVGAQRMTGATPEAGPVFDMLEWEEAADEDMVDLPGLPGLRSRLELDLDEEP
jgi:hypothetical protein